MRRRLTPLSSPLTSLRSRGVQQRFARKENVSKDRIRAYHFLVSLPKQGPWIGWKNVVSAFVIMGAIFGGASGTAHAATPAVDYSLYQGTSAAMPQLEQPGPGAVSSQYLSTYVDRGRSSGSQPMLSGAMTAATAATRCPAFVTWEDWGGSRVHAYVDFHPSDLCNGQHVKRAYVRLVRQCGPYYDTGRIYTYTAGSTSDTRLYSVSVWIYDSVIWSCNTNTYYGYEYF